MGSWGQSALTETDTPDMLKNKEFIRSQREGTSGDRNTSTNNNTTNTDDHSQEQNSSETPKSASTSPKILCNEISQQKLRCTTANNDTQRVTTHHANPCSWCFQDRPPQFFLPASKTKISVFCSESCFSQYRRAVFKQTKTCSTCRKTIPINDSLIIQTNTEDGRQYFCTNKCKALYVKTSVQQQPSQEVLLTPSQLLLAKAWLQSRINQRSKPTTETQTQEKQSLKVKPDHQLLAPPSLSRVSKTRRMAIRDQPTRRFREMQNAERRRRQREQKTAQEANGLSNSQLPKSQFPKPPPSHPPILPPPTLMLPYPVFLPIPLPLFLPVPVKQPPSNEDPKGSPKYQELDLCEGNTDKNTNGVDSTLVDIDVPLVVDIKQEDSKDIEDEAVAVNDEEGTSDKGNVTKKSNDSDTLNKRPQTREEEIRRKRRALIMDR